MGSPISTLHFAKNAVNTIQNNHALPQIGKDKPLSAQTLKQQGNLLNNPFIAKAANNVADKVASKAVSIKFAKAKAGGIVRVALKGKQSLADILKHYQVKDDKLINYSPKAFGSIKIPFADSRRMTATEGKLLDHLTLKKGLMGLNTFKGLVDSAFSTSKSTYPDPAKFPAQAGSSPRDKNKWAQNDGHRDAFRHAYWNALMTSNFGEKFAKQFATAHEGLPGNRATREAMDLKNNEVGRNIAVSNPDASPKELANLIQKAVKNGKLIVIDAGGQLQWSDKVAYGQHGVAKGSAAKGYIPTPDGNAYPK